MENEEPTEELNEEQEAMESVHRKEYDFHLCLVNPKAPGPYDRLIIPEVLEEMQVRAGAYIIGIEEGETAVGAVAGFFDMDEDRDIYFVLGSLYIAPDYRCCGAASILFEEFIKQLQISRKRPRYMLAEFPTEDEDMELLYTFLSEEGMDELYSETEDDVWQCLVMGLNEI